MYNVRIIQSPDRIEIYKVNNYIIKESNKDEGYKLIDKLLKDSEEVTKEKKNKQSLEARRKTLNKSRNNIMRLIQANQDMKVFLTLTFKKENDYKESKAKLNIFFTKLRKTYRNLKYIWVLEYGDINKRLHFHVLCNIPIHIPLANSSEKKSEQHKNLEKTFEKKYWNYGFIDIRSLTQCEDNIALALYVSNYIVKNLKDLDLEGYRVYGYSRKTLNKPVEVKFYSKQSIEQLIKMYPGYKIRYSNNYSIGYTDYRREHQGQVTYIDLIKIKENDYVSKKC